MFKIKYASVLVALAVISPSLWATDNSANVVITGRVVTADMYCAVTVSETTLQLQSRKISQLNTAMQKGFQDAPRLDIKFSNADSAISCPIDNVGYKLSGPSNDTYSLSNQITDDTGAKGVGVAIYNGETLSPIQLGSIIQATQSSEVTSVSFDMTKELTAEKVTEGDVQASVTIEAVYL